MRHNRTSDNHSPEHEAHLRQQYLDGDEQARQEARHQLFWLNYRRVHRHAKERLRKIKRQHHLSWADLRCLKSTLLKTAYQLAFQSLADHVGPFGRLVIDVFDKLLDQWSPELKDGLYQDPSVKKHIVRAPHKKPYEVSLDSLGHEDDEGDEPNFLAGPNSVEDEIKRLELTEAWRILAALAGLNEMDTLLWRLHHGCAMTFHEIINADLSRVEKIFNLNRTQIEAWHQLKQATPAKLANRCARIKVRLQSISFALHLKKQARVSGRDELSLLEEHFSEREVFVLKRHLVGMGFYAIATAYNHHFHEQVDDSEIEGIFFSCVDRFHEKFGHLTVEELLHEILSAEKQKLGQ